MGQRHVDKRWTAPKGTRWVWVHRRRDPHDPPVQGLVVDWRRHSYRWDALVVLVDEEALRMEWFPAEALVPVKRPQPPAALE